MLISPIFSKLTPIERDIALATLERKIKDYSLSDFTVLMLGLIGKTYLNVGHPFDEDKVNMTIDELCNDLQKYSGGMSFTEIELAFKNGYKKEYGEFYGLSNATYFGWVNAYAYGEKRLRVKKALSDAKENNSKEPDKKTPEEIEYILKSGCIKSFDDYRKGVIAPLVDAGNVKYNFLVNKGLINLSKDRKAELMILAEKKLRNLAMESKSPKESIEKCLSKILDLTIQSEAKKMALLDYYKGLTEIEVELSDLLD